MKYNKELGAKMLNELYQMRLWKVRRKEWRKRLSKLNITAWHFPSDEFIATWNYLETNGLIRR